MVRPLRDSDFDFFDPIDVQIGDFAITKSAFMSIDDFPPHQASIVDSSGNIVLMTGLVEVRENVYDTWILFSKAWRTPMYRFLRHLLSDYLSNMKFDKVYHAVRVDRDWMCKAIGLIGFKCENHKPLTKYIDGIDCYMYSIIGSK
jgi:hypothetical protein